MQTDEVMPSFMEGGGQLGALIRAHDWSATSLGPMESWPPELRSALRICLNAGFPFAIYWGQDLTLLYNDAWSAIPGDKHPWSLGKPGKEVWPDIWDTVGPQFEEVLAQGNSFRFTDALLPMYRFGFIEETYFDYSLSPIYKSDGTVAGVFNTGIETTYRIINERRNRFLHALLQELSGARTVRDTYARSARLLDSLRIDIPFSLLYSAADTMNVPTLVQARGSITPAAAEAVRWPFTSVLLSSEPQLVTNLAEKLPKAETWWPEPCDSALVLPLRQGPQQITGFLVAGISPRRRFDTEYRLFLGTIALHISTSLAQTAALEQESAVRRQLEQSEDNLRRLFMQASVGVCILRGEELYVELVNDAYLTIVQRERARFEHRRLWEGLPEVRDQGFDAILQNVLRTGEPFVGKEQLVTIVRNGREENIYVDFVYETLRERDGSFSRIMALVIDVTDKVLARREISRSEERARLAIESADLGTFDVDLLTNDLIASPRMSEIMGVTPGSDRSAYISVIHPDDQDVRAQAYQVAFRTGILQYEGRVIWPDGSMHWTRIKGRVYFDERGEPQKLLGVVQDITEMKQFAAELTRLVEERTLDLKTINEELNRRNDELEQFAYVSSHDLQEPLRKIRMFAEVIREQELDRLSPLAQTRFEKISSSAERMSRSLRDLLEYASLARAEQREEVDLNEVMEQVLLDLELIVMQKGARVEWSGLPLVRAIPLQMHQLLYNLVNNALKFSKTEETPLVTISSRKVKTEEGVFHEIRVQDNGIGFSMDHAQKIFTIFQRLHDRSSYSGSGIGLALCKKVAENHGGSIRAEGVPGEGSAFVILLPASPDQVQ